MPIATFDVADATAGQLLVSPPRQHRSEAKDAAVALHDAQPEMLRSREPGLVPARAWDSFRVIARASAPTESPPHR